jgi:hypothetical protein
MRKTKLFFNCIVVFTLVLVTLGNTSMVAEAGGDTGNTRVDPYLLQLAQDHPDDVFQVIVQKVTKEKNPEKAVAEGGGKVIKHLDLIASFSAEMNGKEVLKLATHKDVRWISSDARVFLAGGFDSNTFKDEFKALAYTGSDGTEKWSDKAWKEVGESDGANKGKVMVVANSKCAAGNCLRLGGSNTSLTGRSVSRAAQLNNATSTTLTFKTRAQATTSTNGTVSVQVSSDKGNIGYLRLKIIGQQPGCQNLRYQRICLVLDNGALPRRGHCQWLSAR